MTRFHTRRSASCLLLLASLGAAAFAQDGSLPATVTLVVPFAAGGVTDAAARALAPELGRQLGQQVVVENRIGAGGRIGAEAVMRGPKDGSIIGILNSGLGTNLPLMSDFKMLPGEQYTPLSNWFETYTVLVANAGQPFDDVQGLIAHARKNPSRLNWGSAGVGTSGHLGMELLKHLAKVDITHVAYKGDSAVTNDLLSNQIQLAISSAPIKPHVDAKKLKAIATTGPVRWTLFNHVPTFQEGGVKGFNLTVWQGFIAPPGLRSTTAERLSRAIRAALQAPDVKAKLEAMGLKTGGSTPEQFGSYIRADLKRWTPVIKGANIKVE